MCTVTYYATPHGIILTHNRDEAPSRSPQAITRKKNEWRTLLYPQDTKAGGTWIISDNKGQTACLLNGAFIKHAHNPPYRRSRGLLLLDAWEQEHPTDFLAQYDCTGIEPFTLLLFSRQIIQEIRWDGVQRYFKTLSVDQPHFWCSSTLYPTAMQERREQVFRNWLQQTTQRKDAKALLDLHYNGSVGDPENDFVMNRGNRVRTVSITQVVKQTHKIQMHYFDLLNEGKDVRKITLRPEIQAPGTLM